MSQEENLLDNLLSVATEELENLNKKENVFREASLFQTESNLLQKHTFKDEPLSSIVHNGDTDSSDEEGNRNYEDEKYSQYGKEIKNLLKSKSPLQSPSCDKRNSSSWKTKSLFAPPNKSHILQNNNTELKKCQTDVFTDAIFGLRIINPLISSTALQEKMIGREAVSFSKISHFLQAYSKEKDWVIAGVIANKSAVKTSQKGNQYCIWTLTDLKNEIKTVSLFLFSAAYKELWKTVVGTVVGVLNPSVLDKKDGSKDEACLSVDNPQKVLVLGHSKDFGTCKSIKKNGEKCTAIVNLQQCEFCIYHIKQEYQKCSKRSELQANFAGRGLTALRNKVLGKNEVFYAGKSYMAIPAKKNKKLQQKDNNRLKSLNDNTISTFPNRIKEKNTKPMVRKQNASRLEVSQAQRLRDIELLKKLDVSVNTEPKRDFIGMHSTEVTLQESKNNAINIISKLKEKQKESSLSNKEDEFNLKSDTFIAETEGTSFQGKLSETVTSDESRVTALSVIAKLKSKTNPSTSKEKSKQCTPYTSNCEFDDDNLDLSFSPKNNKGKSSSLQNGVHSPISNCNKSILPLNCDNISTSTTISDNISAEKVSKDVDKEVDNRNLKNVKMVTDKNHHMKSMILGRPTLSGGELNNIDLNNPITTKHIDKAKLNAIKLIQRNGPLKKADPNSIKGSGRKRRLEEYDLSENAPKKSKLAESEFISDRFKKMMAATSKHLDLLEARDDEEKEKYFTKMERKEQMEEKMANTLKVACKAVRCLKCKYTSFSASDLCKNEKHPLKVFDAMKRFFKCGNCGNRIVSLDIFPTGLCKNCGSGKWEKTGMMKEKIAAASHTLSIRGGEQTFMNSAITDANVNLLVPDN